MEQVNIFIISYGYYGYSFSLLQQKQLQFI